MTDTYLNEPDTTAHTDASDIVDRGQRLFRFLAEAQRLKNRPVLDARNYQATHWAYRFPDHSAVRGAFQDREPEPGEPVLVVDRLPAPAEPPAPPELVMPWLAGSFNDPHKPPTLVESDDDADAFDADANNLLEQESADRVPAAEAFDEWMTRWSAWSAQVIFDEPARQLYKDLFATSASASARQEELEVVLGIGLLDWEPPDHEHVSRHVLTCPLAVDFDDHSGTISVTAPEPVEFTLELEMLEPALVGAGLVNATRDRIAEQSGHPLNRAVFGEVIKGLVQSLSAESAYSDDDAPTRTGEPRAAFAPAIILRKRSSSGLIEVFEQMAAEIDESRRVPDGLMPLIDPDFQIPTESDPSPGGIVPLDDDDDLMLPLPLNNKQMQVVQRANTRAQTLVQGPPGTGKTHTAAALMSHLLAQGKRVLVTAQTDRALKEVRSKLPESIRPLAVSVVGTDREEFGNLKAAVDGLSRAASERDAVDDDSLADHEIGRHLSEIDKLRRQRAETRQAIVAMREHEVVPREHAGSAGTLSTIAQKHGRDSEQHRWILELATPGADERCPLDSREARRWLDLLGDTGLNDDEPDADKRLPELDDLPSPDEFAAMVDAESDSASAAQNHAALTEHAAYQAIVALSSETRTELQQRMGRIARQVQDLEGSAQTWMDQALRDVRSGRGSEWQARAETIDELIASLRPTVEQVHPATTVAIDAGIQVGQLKNLATALLAYIRDSGPVKTHHDGTPKIGAFTHKTVKNSKPLFDAVRVDASPPATAEALTTFLNVVEGRRQLDALDRAWPASVMIPEEDTLRERLQWHATELEQLRRILQLGDSLNAEQEYLSSIGLSHPDWNNIDEVRTYAALVDAATAGEHYAKAAASLDVIAGELISHGQRIDASDVFHRLASATSERDRRAYETAYQRVMRLHQVREQATERDALTNAVASAAPRLADAVSQHPRDSRWPELLGRLTESWDWARTDAWLRTQDSGDVNAIQARLGDIEQSIRREVEALASSRAWRHATAPTRLTGSARANLAHYSERVRKLGKGTGKYAAQRQADVREAMNRCRSAVPAWIMPLYRLTQQLQVSGDMFDVVIVDEASQAGVEAAFLLHLAPKVIVIGDDKQVSPVDLKINRDSMRQLGKQYLFDIPHSSSWQDPELSLFDLCVARFGARITLVEHRRCVPEIIEFSNQIAYIPENIRLLPVRQYGTDRLEPIQVVHVSDGYESGKSGANANMPEADAIVEQIQACLADPAYAGRTMGVISLVGSRQAKLIESKLSDAIANEEWNARDLRCGDATDFQGSERDVMFLSMVSGPKEGKRMGSLTRELNMQRFNVAASRAKDQLWVFHTITLADVPNTEDVRHQLLDYCYGVVNRRAAGESESLPVPDDELVAPFDSLFEQRVYNRIVERGFTVEPQFDANGYRIDLVVVGGANRLAIECDGDHWHGPDAYLSDLARQRDLERCGWSFFRIRESEWYTDETAVLEALWRQLESLQIRPAFVQESAYVAGGVAGVDG